jgi:DNA-binding MarR family transcriptional regulator
MIVLTTLAIENRPLDFTECSHLSGLRKPSVSRSLDYLRRFCLVDNHMNSKDRRKRMLSITPEGRALVAKLCEASA